MKKRLLFFTNSLYGGGAEKVLQTLLSNLDLNKYDITLYSVNEGVLNDSYPKGINYKYIFKQNSTSFLSRLWAKIYNKFKLIIYYKFSPRTFYRLFVKGKYDTEIAFIEGYSTRIISGSTNRYSKKLAWVHIDLKNNHWTTIAYKSAVEEAQCYAKFNTIVNVSESVKKNSIHLFGNNNLVTIYNPIDVNNIIELSNFASSKIPKLGNIKLITIGRLVPQKGYDRLLPIVKQLIDEGHDISLTILGEGSERTALEKYVVDNNLQNKVFLPGFVKNPYSIMAKHDIFVCSSRAEGYSLVIAEAMIIGLPIVSTYCSGPNELLNNGEYGILTHNSDTDLKLGLKSIISKSDIYKHFKNKAIERGAHFSLKKQISEIEKIL